MAGIFLWHKSKNYKEENINNTFIKLDYKPGKTISLGEWNLIVFPKTCYKIQNWYSTNGCEICGVGTFAYKHKLYNKALPLIYNDFKNRELEMTAFWGSFIIILITQDGLTLIRDGAGLYRMYTHVNGLVFSTSFAGLMESTEGRLSFDRDVATELLVSGVLTGNRTLVKEIQRIHSGQNFEKINIIETTTSNLAQPNFREEALSQQIKITKDYIKRVTKDWFSYIPNSVIDVGITAGMDSRLCLMLTLESKSNIVLHTHWRKEGSANRDFRYSKILSESLGIPIHIKEVTHPSDMKEDELKENFKSSYQLCDAVIRPGCYWDEPYSTAAYRLKLTKPPYLRFLGFGGEQYRNNNRLPLKSPRGLKSWIKWEMIHQFAGWNFTDNVKAEEIIEQIEANLVNQLGVSRLNLENYKMYIRLIQSPSYRALQAQIENRLGFCINPFLDIHLSIPSSMIIKFLGKSLGFQLEMMKRISEEISSIPNEYGFNFAKGEPIKSRIYSAIWLVTPPGLKYRAYSILTNYHRTDYIPRLSHKYKFIRDLVDNVQDLGLPIDIKKHQLVRSHGKLILNLGYFLKRNQSRISL